MTIRAGAGGPSDEPVPERPVVAHALTVVDHVFLLATDRGVFRSTDDGARWTLGGDTLPAHLDAGMLARDPVEVPTIYVGFAVRSHETLAQAALHDRSTLDAITPSQLAGGLGVLALALVGAVVGVRRLVRTHAAARPAVPR